MRQGDQEGDQTRIIGGASGCDPAECIDELIDVRYPFLEEVAETFRAAAQERSYVFDLNVLRKQEDTHLCMSFPAIPRRP